MKGTQAVTRICENWACGKEYVVPPQNLYPNQRPQKYCSQKCAGAARGRSYLFMPIGFCQNADCGRAFAIRRDTAGKYCSMRCSLQTFNTKRRRCMPRIICQNPACAREFAIPRTHNKQNGPRRFCSDACKWAAWRSPPRRCPDCGAICTGNKCLACYRRRGRAAPSQVMKHCRDCGVVIGKYIRLCEQCRELSILRRKALKNKHQKHNIQVGREMVNIFPNLFGVLLGALDNYSGEERRNRKKMVFAKIGAEGAKIFNMRGTKQ